MRLERIKTIIKENNEKVGSPPALTAGSIFDSPADPGPRSYSFYESFKYLLDGTDSLGSFVGAQMEGIQDPIAVEFGGSGVRLFQTLPKIFFQTIGVLLGDSRTFKKEAQQTDNLNKHTVIEADILLRSTLKKVLEKTNGRKANLVISRMAGGFVNIAFADPNIMFTLINRWVHDVLDERGVILVQVPVALNNDVPAYAQKLEKEGLGTIKVTFHLGSANTGSGDNTVLLIQRNG